LTAVFAVDLVFLIDADRGDTFFAVFLLVVLAFLAAFLRVAVARESFQRRFIIQN
jgi:hypothetical protein